MNHNKLIIIGLPMIAVTYGLARFSYGLMLPYINNTLEMGASISGFISSLSYLAYCFAIIAAIYLSDKVTSKSILMIAGISAVLGLLLITVSPNAWILGVGVFIAGISTGLSSPPYASIVNQYINPNVQNQTNSWINAGTSIGTAFTGAIAILMTDSWREAYLIFTIIALIVLFLNFKGLPKGQQEVKKRTFRYSKRELKTSLSLIIVSLLIGISSSAYWTFSKTFLTNIDQLPEFLGNSLWIIIGLSGLLGGTAGIFINNFGIVAAYRLSIILLASSSLLLSMSTNNATFGLLSPLLFGSSYIFMTGVLIVWGISIFKNSPSLGLGIPFLMLALGQTIGSILSGQVADLFGFNVLFIASAIVGYLALLSHPKINA